MTEQNNERRASVEQAYSRLVYELYTNGPITLVSDNGHLDLVNKKVRLCCQREPFLDVINVMQKECFIEEIEARQHERVYALTKKGFLAAIIMRYRRRSDDPCQCTKHTEAFEYVLRELLRTGPLQLVVSRSGHPHLLGNKMQFCCDKEPFLDAMCNLERYRLVEMTDDFTYRLTARGLVTAQLLLLPHAKAQSDRALWN